MTETSNTLVWLTNTLCYEPLQFFSETVVQTCSVKKVFLEILQNSQENACARVFILIKLQAWALQIY